MRADWDRELLEQIAPPSQKFPNELKRNRFKLNREEDCVARCIDNDGYHTTALDAASAANEANVRLLVFNHLGPSPPDNMLTRLIFARGLNKIRPQSQWRIGFDGMIIDLPAGERAIQFAPKLR